MAEAAWMFFSDGDDRIILLSKNNPDFPIAAESYLYNHFFIIIYTEG